MIHVAYSVVSGLLIGATTFTAEEVAAGFSRPAGKGHAILIVPPEQNGNAIELQALITQATGLDPGDMRHALVESKTGAIKWVGITCPTCEDIPAGHEFVKDPGVDYSWAYDTNQKKLAAPPVTPLDPALVAAKMARLAQGT